MDKLEGIVLKAHGLKKYQKDSTLLSLAGLFRNSAYDLFSK